MKFTNLALLLLLPLAAASAELTGTVVRVVDGDTVHVLDAENTRHKIRLAGIDTPERKQPFGQKAKERLSGMSPVRMWWWTGKSATGTSASSGRSCTTVRT